MHLDHVVQFVSSRGSFIVLMLEYLFGLISSISRGIDTIGVVIGDEASSVLVDGPPLESALTSSMLGILIM